MCLHPFEYTRAHPHTLAKNNLNITRAEHYQREEPQISNGKKKKDKVNLQYWGFGISVAPSELAGWMGR